MAGSGRRGDRWCARGWRSRRSVELRASGAVPNPRRHRTSHSSKNQDLTLVHLRSLDSNDGAKTASIETIAKPLQYSRVFDLTGAVHSRQDRYRSVDTTHAGLIGVKRKSGFRNYRMRMFLLGSNTGLKRFKYNLGLSTFSTVPVSAPLKRLLAKQCNHVLKRLHTRKTKGGSRRVNAAKLVSQRRDSLPMAVRLSGCSSFGNRLASQRKCHVERLRRGAIDNVRTDSQPIRRQIRIPDPGLQIRHTSRKRSSARGHDRSRP